MTAQQNGGAFYLVTGANAGIGYEIARGLAKAEGQPRVILAVRDAAKGEAARAALAEETGNANLSVLVIDLASQASIRRAAAEFLKTHDSLDALVNNAGMSAPTRQESVDGIELTFATNVLGYFMLTNLLLDALKKAPAGRIVNVASEMAYGLELEDVEFKKRTYNPSTAYAQSKQADRMLTWAYARRLEGTSVTANAMSPGPVDTPLLHSLAPGMKGRTREKGAETVVWLATSADVAGVSNKLWFDKAERICKFHNVEQEEKLWAVCEGLAGKGKS
ncbi:MAG TPA: SDR family NAD(P)-dependent oxidoreductase [Candidatus Acidoferrales bacterium]